jgi:hypothetical protein
MKSGGQKTEKKTDPKERCSGEHHATIGHPLQHRRKYQSDEHRAGAEAREHRRDRPIAETEIALHVNYGIHDDHGARRRDV